MNTLYEGLSLMVIGMGTVFAFLTMLVIVITIVSKLILRYFPEVEQNVEQTAVGDHNQTLVAVISAAIARYRKPK